MRWLHVGCGPVGCPIPMQFAGWQEIRMDIEPAVKPDMIGSITSIDLPDNSMDGVYASHVLEHVETWEVQPALGEVLRVLKPGATAIIVTPDLVAWCREIIENPGDVERVTPGTGMGPVSPLDALFGFQSDVYAGLEGMRHRTAFTALTLADHLRVAGFASAKVLAQAWQLCAIAQKGLDDGKEG